jgi:hypothetical protein
MIADGWKGRADACRDLDQMRSIAAEVAESVLASGEQRTKARRAVRAIDTSREPSANANTVAVARNMFAAFRMTL